MPELPEVETIRRCLLPQVVGCRMTGVVLLWPGIVRQPSPQDFCIGIVGQAIEDIQRRGKYLLFRLSSRRTLVVHLKMTGRLLLESACAEAEPHTRVVFHLDGNMDLHLWDQRKFGAVWLVDDENEVIGRLGVEPLEDGFTPDLLQRILCGHKVPVKALLLDQHAIAGIGNMYADEALFAARISPMRLADELSREQVARLHEAIRRVLAAGVEHGGASVSTYRQPDGSQGRAQEFFMVAHRAGDHCMACDTLLRRMVVRGRGTYYCPRCQRT
ncbi:MAG: bifunctional DNA-formamidopyrimidine glycosylase/DNA-(apurinic or apyrimidinic site) lyase [Chloroflexi bacterium]|nr:bifunctional DNA-formamidopyrimidine glycosylase/DNA-(apurinic or apyrimidinic site) lyase [Chloroflexota bacterium]